MTFIKPDEWTPSQGILMDGKALEIVKANTTMSILAGPGAGKTELLAQRASYLLTTGLCPPPQKILAIAFKVDAARNLHDRVAERCDVLKAQRFESLTLDAFAKKLVDQFLEALPEHIRPTPNYQIVFPSRDILEEFKNRNSAKYPALRGLNNTQLERLIHCSIPISQLADATTQDQQIQWEWWHQQIHSSESFLTFDMLKWLAIFILQNQSNILSALRRTYSHIFLDEFQDITFIQYKLILVAFLGSGAVLTAVGDSNQAIMRWAGARADIFDQFQTDFNANDEQLLFNFRSNAQIVHLINNLATTFDENYVPTECARANEPMPNDAVSGWLFDTRQEEAKYIASFIVDELKQNTNLSPSDFVILARLRVDDIENRIKPEFHSLGLKVRNEARSVGGIAIQDLVKEKAYQFLLASLKLSVNVRDGQPFMMSRNTIADVRGSDLNSDHGHSSSLAFTRDLVDHLKTVINGRAPIEVSSNEIADTILTHVEPLELQRTYREYIAGERLNTVVEGFKSFFDECKINSNSWLECISNMEGNDAVRLMTIHKSKGLEYNTVFFVEFNDDAFWGNDDDINVFFVAISRAKERVCFSLTKDSKGIENVKNIYKKLEDSGIKFEKNRKPMSAMCHK